MKTTPTHATNILGLALVLMLTGAPATAHDHDHAHQRTTHSHAGVAPANLPLSESVTADGCWIRQLPPPTPSGGFLVIRNQGSEPAIVESAASADYADIMLHQTTEENGVSKMAMIHQLTVPAGQSVELKPGSYHLMLEGPRDGLAVGDNVHIQFSLGDGTAVAATCEVMSVKATGRQ